jgi:hypothetical protein
MAAIEASMAAATAGGRSAGTGRDSTARAHGAGPTTVR